MVFQFTLPRGERPGKQNILDNIAKVSIHAPAWGATEDELAVFDDERVSIHAPAWGATGGVQLPPS